MKLLAIDFRRLAVLLLPTFLRGLVNTSLIQSFMPSISDLQDRFFAVRESNLYKLNHNGQVCYLRKVLNDAFPARNKDFILVDYEPIGQWLWAKDESDLYTQLMIPDDSSLLIYSVQAIGDYANFIVRIPSSLSGDDNINRIRSIVNTYKLLSKKAIYEYY